MPETVEYNIKFVGIDDWNRPGYKVEGLNVYLGDVDKLFDWNTPKEVVDAYFKEHIEDLVIFGTTFDKGHDPLGTSLKSNIKLNII